MEKKEDRRVRYTKALLKDALVDLLLTEPISSISVKQLCEHADVNRSTFYAHYSDQYDLLAHVEDEVFENVKAYLFEQAYDPLHPVSEQVLNQILKYAKENSKTIQALLSENSNLVFQRKIMQLVDIVTVPENSSLGEWARNYVSIFGIDGCVSIIKMWIKGGMKEPTEDIAMLIIRLLYAGMNGLNGDFPEATE